jgi:hypothetical protein
MNCTIRDLGDDSIGAESKRNRMSPLTPGMAACMLVFVSVERLGGRTLTSGT